MSAGESGIAPDAPWSVTVTAYKHRQLQRIASIAFDLAARDGLPNVSMSSLARAAGLSRATLYNYIPDVATAVRIQLVARAEAFQTAVTAAVAEERGSEAQLRRYVREQVAYASGDDHRAAIALAESARSLDDEASAAAHVARQAGVLDDILRRGMREGVFRTAPIVVQAALIGRALYGADDLLHRLGLPEDAVAEAITAFVLEGIGR
ncbi:TetR/AcrR family transcriptional regulator [Microbacterium terrisoli]|uniref:TetR/AcrR family transcriptional regulator n=1 Tax=Microbacterium terrisoli TaxID=3242192 RepID=UPI0028037989|nr:TetR/AcrR family transcriptional regulator [Microbacterium protaetiae]